MRYLLILFAAMFALTSCGDFYVLGGEPDPWDSITMRVGRDSACVMQGDSMPLRVGFSPSDPSITAVYWYSTDMQVATVKNDTMVAAMPGDVSVIVVSANGRLSDTCRVKVIDRWEADSLEYSNPYDMVVYAHILVGGEEWDAENQMVAAFLGQELVGVAVPQEAYGIRYALIRLWTDVDADAGNIFLRCYDRRNFMLYECEQMLDHDALKSLGTLSSLYPINF